MDQDDELKLTPRQHLVIGWFLLIFGLAMTAFGLLMPYLVLPEWLDPQTQPWMLLMLLMGPPFTIAGILGITSSMLLTDPRVVKDASLMDERKRVSVVRYRRTCPKCGGPNHHDAWTTRGYAALIMFQAECGKCGYSIEMFQLSIRAQALFLISLFIPTLIVVSPIIFGPHLDMAILLTVGEALFFLLMLGMLYMAFCFVLIRSDWMRRRIDDEIKARV